jgi:hypothetical protein
MVKVWILDQQDRISHETAKHLNGQAWDIIEAIWPDCRHRRR